MAASRALLIVDVQRAFQPPAPLVEKIAKYSRRYPQRVFTRYVNPESSVFRRLLKLTACPPGSPDLELLIPPRPGDLVLTKIAKYGLSMPQIRRLKERNISRVTVCGLDTDACVMAVMFSLFDAGIECHLKEDLCWSSSGLHDAAMSIIREQFPAPH